MYDDLHRLTSATITNTANSSNYTRTYTYNIIGNITNKSDLGNYTYANIHPHAVTSANSVTYSYDNNGSLTGDGTWTHTYDTRNRLIESDDSTDTIDYTYDEGRARLTKDDGTTLNIYVNDYFEKEGGEERMYIYANNLKVAGIIDGDDVFYHEDHLSGSNISTDDLGDQLELNDYFPYGDQRIEDRATGYENDYLFTGQERDEETDLYYYNARYYDAELGRFASVDPWFGDIMDPQSLNKFSYVRNNPLRYVDPTGMYNEESGEIEEGDTMDSITNEVNEALGIETDWDTIASVSFLEDRFGSTDPADLIGEFTYTGTDSNYDITWHLDLYNETRSQALINTNGTALDLAALFKSGGPWDLKNSSHQYFGMPDGERKYWSYIYNGDLVRFDAPGNINFGFVANAIHLDKNTAIFGAAVEQWGSDIIGELGKLGSGQGFKWPSFGDNTGDIEYIKQGYELSE